MQVSESHKRDAQRRFGASNSISDSLLYCEVARIELSYCWLEDQRIDFSIYVNGNLYAILLNNHAELAGLQEKGFKAICFEVPDFATEESVIEMFERLSEFTGYERVEPR